MYKIEDKIPESTREFLLALEAGMNANNIKINALCNLAGVAPEGFSAWRESREVSFATGARLRDAYFKLLKEKERVRNEQIQTTAIID